MSETPACRLLLVEDDTGIGRLLERGLAAEGYAVDWVRTLAAATEAARPGGHDLVLLDRMLPDGDGAAFCAALPLRSVPLEAAVGEVLGTLSVLVAVIWMRAMSTWKTSATT